MSHLPTTPRSALYCGTSHEHRRCTGSRCTHPRCGARCRPPDPQASTGQPLRHVGSTQWLHPIDRYERVAFGNHPPSISPTRRQLMAAGLLPCSLQATTQHLQPMHFFMSKWEAMLLARRRRASACRQARRCPAKREPARAVQPALLRRVNAKVRPSGVARSRSGKARRPLPSQKHLALNRERWTRHFRR